MESRWLADIGLLAALSRGGLWLWACLGLLCKRLSLPGGVERAVCPRLARVLGRQHLARSSSEPGRKGRMEQSSASGCGGPHLSC